ncbi:MAG: FAD-dependent oxidoreductase [Acidobacteria bacterium]|nr:FAD-dependent oxidoreductase [Acidobacteriota bacterium]
MAGADGDYSEPAAQTRSKVEAQAVIARQGRFTHRCFPRELAFYVSIPSATDPTLAPSGCSAMFVLVPAPLVSDMPGADWATVTASIRAQVLERMASHGSPIDPRQIVCEEVYTPVDWQRRFGLYDGSAFGAAHTIRQLGPLRAPNYSREVPGLFYVGASTTPDTGMPMVVLSGRLVAERIVSQLGSPLGELVAEPALA